MLHYSFYQPIQQYFHLKKTSLKGRVLIIPTKAKRSFSSPSRSLGGSVLSCTAGMSACNISGGYCTRYTPTDPVFSWKQSEYGIISPHIETFKNHLHLCLFAGKTYSNLLALWFSSLVNLLVVGNISWFISTEVWWPDWESNQWPLDLHLTRCTANYAMSTCLFKIVKLDKSTWVSNQIVCLDNI